MIKAQLRADDAAITYSHWQSDIRLYCQFFRPRRSCV